MTNQPITAKPPTKNTPPTICGVQTVGVSDKFEVRIGAYYCQIYEMPIPPGKPDEWSIEVTGPLAAHRFYKTGLEVARVTAEATIMKLIELEKDAMGNLQAALKWQEDIARKLMADRKQREPQ